MENKNTDNNTDNVVLEEQSTNTRFCDKKKLTVLIVAAVLVLAVIVVGMHFLTLKNFTGAWELTTNPELTQATDDQIDDSDRVYYIFEKPDKFGKGEWATYYDGGVEYYEYELSQIDTTDKVNLGSVDLEYKFSGSKLLGNAQLTLIYPEYTDESTGETVEAQEYVLTQAKNPEYEKQSYDEYNTDDKLTIVDATTLQLALVEKTELSDVGQDLADYDLNSRTSITDATAIQIYLANGK